MSLVLIILTVQAYSDLKTMQLYYWLTVSGMAAGVLPCIINTDSQDILYIIICLGMIYLQYKIRAYTIGDAKLCVMVLELIILKAEKADIVLRFFAVSAVSMIIFLLYVFVKKLTDGLNKNPDRKKRKKYPYAQAIMISVLTNIWGEIYIG